MAHFLLLTLQFMRQVIYSLEKIRKFSFLVSFFSGGSCFQRVPVPRLYYFTARDQHGLIQREKLFKSVLGFVYLAYFCHFIPPEIEKRCFSTAKMIKTFIKR